MAKTTRLERMRALNPGVSDAELERAVDVNTSARQSKRDQVGKTFQRDLDATHERLLSSRCGLVMRQHVPFRMTKDGWQPAGHARCDYAGHVNMQTVIKSAGGQDYSMRLSENGNPVPIYFDAKVLMAEHASYVHSIEQQHQITDLRAALGAGGYAFLLVYVRPLERAIAIGIAEHFDELIRRQAILLYERSTYRQSGHAEPALEPLLPSCEWTALAGWQWWRCLEHLQRGDAFVGQKRKPNPL